MGCLKLTYNSNKIASNYSLKVIYSKTSNDYYPYARQLRKYVPGGGDEKYLSTGHERDHETISENNSGTGYDYRINRYYDSDIARFVSVDKLASAPEQIDKSPYAYVWGNPIALTDPDGNCPKCYTWLAKNAAQDPNGFSAHLLGFSKGGANAVEGIKDAIFNPLQTLQTAFELAKPLDGANLTQRAFLEQIYNDQQAILNGNGFQRGEVFGRYGTDAAITRGVKGLKTTRATKAPVKVQWPLNNGFKGSSQAITLEKGMTFDRYGDPGGCFASPIGTPATQRSLAPGTTSKPLNQYQVLKPFEAQSGTVAPWFGQTGGGTQYMFNTSVQQLIDGGFIAPIKP